MATTRTRKLAPLEFMSAAYGTTGISGTETTTGFFDGIVIDEADSEIDEILDVNGNDVTTLLGCGAGTLLSQPKTIRHSTIITSVTWGAGQGTLINAK